MTERIKLKKAPCTWSIRQIHERVRREIAQQEARHLILHPEGDMVERHLSVNSGFCKAMVNCGYLTPEQIQHAACRYRLGMTRDGGVIFWQIDLLNDWHDGKIMYYREDGHRDHYHNPTWVYTELKRFYLGKEHPLFHETTSTHCLFGLHLLKEGQRTKDEGLRSKDEGQRTKDEGLRSEDDGVRSTVCVVEAEKTAVVMSEKFPQHLWLATGGLNELTPNKLFPLRGHRVILFPDTDEDGRTYRLWYEMAQKAKFLLGHSVTVSPLLELQATPDQKRRKIDLVDYLFERSKRGV